MTCAKNPRQKRLRRTISSSEHRKSVGSNRDPLRDSPMQQWVCRVLRCLLPRLRAWSRPGQTSAAARWIPGAQGLRFSRYRNSFRKVQAQQDCSRSASGLSSDSQSESCPQLPHLSSRAGRKNCRYLLLAYSHHLGGKKLVAGVIRAVESHERRTGRRVSG